MKVKVGENLIELTKKNRVVGDEAPSIRLQTLNGETKVCGMMADKVQVFFFLANILDCKDEYKTIFDEFKDSAYIYTLTSASNSKLATIVNRYNYDSSFFSAEFLQAAQKFGVSIEDKMCANGCFVISKDGEFTYIDIADDISNSIDFVLAKQKIKEAIEFKKKGHTHENWMGV